MYLPTSLTPAKHPTHLYWNTDCPTPTSLYHLLCFPTQRPQSSSTVTMKKKGARELRRLGLLHEGAQAGAESDPSTGHAFTVQGTVTLHLEIPGRRQVLVTAPDIVFDKWVQGPSGESSQTARDSSRRQCWTKGYSAVSRSTREEGTPANSAQGTTGQLRPTSALTAWKHIHLHTDVL